MYLAIDIGATKTLLALFSPRGRKLQTAKFPTPRGQSAFFTELQAQLAPFKHQKITSITIAVPGAIAEDGSIKFGNLPWRDPDFPAALSPLFGATPIHIQNDADLATLYEAHFYPRKKVCYLTFSTGIGAGLAANGQLLPASATFEPGHRHYDFRGQDLEWEDFAAASAIRKAYGDRLVTELRGRAAYADLAARLAPGLIDIAKEQRPDIFIIGGPLGLVFPRFRRPLRRLLESRLAHTPRLVAAQKPTESVIHGAYLYAKNH